MANVVILMSDEHNPFISSVYGHSYVATPNMERMAESGTVFKNTYCPSPLCLPSRSAFMSGRRVHEIQTYSNCNVNLTKDYPGFGGELSKQGIYTAHIGKTDAYDSLENLGFSEVIMSEDREEPGDINFIRSPLTIRKGSSNRAKNGYKVREDAFDGDISTIDEAINWLKKVSPSLTQPWVLIVNILKPHFPHWTTPDLWDMYPDGGDLPEYGLECQSAKHPYAEDLRAHFETDMFTEEQVRGLRRGYLGCVSFVDKQLGRIMDTLKEIGQQDKTNFIYTADHGEMLGKFGLWWKCSMYEDSVRIPCIACGPDFKKGTIVNTPVDLLDVQASIFESVKAERPAQWSGKPLQLLDGNDRGRVVFSEYHGHGTRSGAYMIRKGDWKLICCMDAPNQLFNLSEDPDELRNVYDNHPEKSRELEEELRNICSPEMENERAFSFQKEQARIIGGIKV